MSYFCTSKPNQTSPTQPTEFRPLLLQALAVALMVSGLLTHAWPIMIAGKTVAGDSITLCAMGVLSVYLSYQYGFRFVLHTLLIMLLMGGLAMLALKFAVWFPSNRNWVWAHAYAQVLNVSWISFVVSAFKTAIVFMGVAAIIRGFCLPKLSAQKSITVISVLTLSFVWVILVSNLVAQKLVRMDSILSDVGTLYFPLSYILNDIFTELFGFSVARKIIWTGFVANLCMILGLQTTVWYLAPSTSGSQNLIHIVGQVPRFIIASQTAYLVGEQFNSYFMVWLKRRWSGRYLGLRASLSTMVGVALDSVIFVVIAFVGVIPLLSVARVTAWEWAFKIGYELCAIPLIYWIVRTVQSKTRS